MSIAQQVLEIIDEQDEIFIDRSEELMASWLALLARVHLFMLGPPGVAKSMLANDMTGRIVGANLFKYLVRKDSTFEEVFGPVKLSALQNDRYEFITSNRLPEAHLVFLDEIMKGGSTLQNSLLTAMEERQFDNGGRRTDIPLMTLFSASNELPDDIDEVGPFYDRLLIRLHVRDLEADSDFRELLLMDNVRNQARKSLEMDDLIAAQEAVQRIDTAPVADKIVELRSRIAQEVGVIFSARRWKQGLNVVRAHAYLNERSVAIPEDLEVFKWMLWDTLEEKGKVTRIVLGAVNPLNEKFIEIMDAATEQYEQVKVAVDAGSNDASLLASEANKAMKELIGKLEDLKEGTEGTFVSKVDGGIRKLRDYNKYFIRDGMGMNI